MSYKIVVREACFEVTYDGRHLAAYDTYREAQEHIGQCQENDAAIVAECRDWADHIAINLTRRELPDTVEKALPIVRARTTSLCTNGWGWSQEQVIAEIAKLLVERGPYK